MRHVDTPTLRARAAARLLALLLGVAPAVAVAQTAVDSLPFGLGERLTYSARVGKFGRVGSAEMWVDGPAEIRGTETYVLRFRFQARVGPVKAEDRTESWLDARHMAVLQFHKHERHVLSKHDETVEIYPSEKRWRADDGESGESPTDASLDELSFMYFIRTLPLARDTVFEFNRHFDAARNPTTVRVVRREDVTTDAGQFHTVLLEMRVKDPRRYHGEGVIRISLTDDDRRLPVRIESAMPMIGTAVLTLDAHVEAPRQVLARGF